MTRESRFSRKNDVNHLPRPSNTTLGILAGGRATRLGGIDKAWLERDGVPQVLRLASRFALVVHEVLVSANRDSTRYAGHGLQVIRDRHADAGPLGGLDALAQACNTAWLLTIPVDVIGVNECLLPSLQAATAKNGAFAEDEDGPQPLVAMWRVDALRDAVAATIEARDLAVHALQAQLGMACVRFPGVRFGNLNTPADLHAAGYSPQ